MRELRSAVMILVEAVNTPIGVGSKLMIQWRFDQHGTHRPQPGWRSAGESRLRRLAVDEKAGNREHVRSRGAVFEMAGPGASPSFAGGRCHSGRGPKAGVIPLPTEL